VVLQLFTPSVICDATFPEEGLDVVICDAAFPKEGLDVLIWDAAFPIEGLKVVFFVIQKKIQLAN
jgi:hypothetical protein